MSTWTNLNDSARLIYLENENRQLVTQLRNLEARFTEIEKEFDKRLALQKEELRRIQEQQRVMMDAWLERIPAEALQPLEPGTMSRLESLVFESTHRNLKNLVSLEIAERDNPDRLARMIAEQLEEQLDRMGGVG